ncbi:MAG TPA: hypothetical protein PKC24_07045 [Cyclobacteriaceae bacterium]|nr:hypothetical protein [Cyclobacteriaceae bacterium]
MRKIKFILGAIAFTMFMTLSSSENVFANDDEELGGGTVTCTCSTSTSGRCVANGESASTCWTSNKCWKGDGNCQ